MKYTQALLMLLAVGLLSCSQTAENYIDKNGNGQLDPYEDTSLSVDERAEDLLSRLSTEQKVNLVVGMGMNMPGMGGDSVKEKVPGAAGSTSPVPEVGLSSIVLADGPAGLRISPIRDSSSTQTYYCTAFPIASQVASSWDVELARKIGQAMGSEVKEYGVDVLLAPAQNIHRNPLAGRNFEYFSEDPYLSGHMSGSVAAGVQENGVGTSIKHFAANNQETNRMLLDAVIRQRALREIYLRGFELSIKKAEPWTVMSAYNKVNGTYASQSEELLSTILRDEWGYEGIVVTDWFAGNDAVAQMKAGNDLLMPGVPDQRTAISEAIENGSLDMTVLDLNVKRILKIILKSPSYNGYEYSDNPDLLANAMIAREAAAEGIVLLENNDALPLANGYENIAVFGNGSYDFIAGGTGSGDVNEKYTVSLVEGMLGASLPVDEEIRGVYEEYISKEKEKLPEKRFFFELLPPIPEMPLTTDMVDRKAQEADLAFITIGRNSGEFQDRKTEGDFYLTQAELEMIEKVSTSFRKEGKKVVMILNIGNVIETESWKDKVDAMVLAWQGGQEAGNAVVDVLTGKVTPSGKLPTSFSITYEDQPSAPFFPGETLEGAEEVKMGALSMGTPAEVLYNEDIYVGYRYYTTFDKPVSYPFGYGLSYTSFDYEKPELTSDDYKNQIEGKVTVSNVGDFEGKEVVQFYLSAPGKDLKKPTIELKAFGKTNSLKPGTSAEVSFKLEPKDLASFDSERSAWVIEAGTYTIHAAASSEDLRTSVSFDVDEDLIVETVNDVLQPNKSLQTISR